VAHRYRALLAASFAALGLILVTTACSGGGSPVTTSVAAAGSPSAAALPSAPASSAVSLAETGSTLLFPLFNLWAPGYRQQYRQVKISTAGTGSGKGISGAAAGTADIGASEPGWARPSC
jgi:phosphate transport system substrate-binding protein